MSKKKTKTLQEFLPALAAAARAAGPAIGRAALQQGVGSMMDEEEEMEEIVGPSDAKRYDIEEIVGPSDGYRPDDVSEAYLSMLESQLEEEGTLDEFLGKAGEMAGQVASSPMKMQAKVVKGFGKGLGLGEAEEAEDEPRPPNRREVDKLLLQMGPGQGRYKEGPWAKVGKPSKEQEVDEEMYPKRKDYPQDGPYFPVTKKEGTAIQDEITVNRGAEGPKKEAEQIVVDEEMFPKKKDYPQDGPYFPRVKEACEEETIDEEMYPAQADFPSEKPYFPRVVTVTKGGVKESFVLVPYNGPLNEGRMAAVFQKFLTQASQILGQLDPQDLVQAGQSIMNMIQGLATAKRQAQAGFAEGYLGEAGTTPPPVPPQTSTPEIQRWFQQFMSQKPPSVSDEQAQQISSQIMSQLGAGQQPTKPTAPPPGSAPPGQRGPVFTAPKGPSPYDAKTYESKRFIMSKDQLTDALKESILLHEKKKMVDRIVKKQIKEQIEVRRLCESLLAEGPMGNMWQGVKDAGRAFMGGMQGGAEGSQQSVARGQMQDQAKQAQRFIAQAVKQVERAKGKFTQETLKSADLIHQYHESVMGLLKALQQVQGILPGPQLAQLQNQVHQAVGQLQYDLESEKSGIDTFLQSLSKAQPGKKGTASGQKYTPPSPTSLPSAKELGKQARGRAQQQRAEENPPPSQTARLAASPGVRRAGKGKSSSSGGSGRPSK